MFSGVKKIRKPLPLSHVYENKKTSDYGILFTHTFFFCRRAKIQRGVYKFFLPPKGDGRLVLLSISKNYLYRAWTLFGATIFHVFLFNQSESQFSSYFSLFFFVSVRTEMGSRPQHFLTTNQYILITASLSGWAWWHSLGDEIRHTCLGSTCFFFFLVGGAI